jgi:hypothetical protein
VSEPDTRERPLQMADIVNLRRSRKAKDKQAKEKLADANRIAFGRTKSEKALAKARNEIAGRTLSAHQMTKSTDKS